LRSSLCLFSLCLSGVNSIIPFFHDPSPLQETFNRIKELNIKVYDLLLPHLKKEEDTILIPEYCTDIPEDAVKQVNQKILAMVKSTPPQEVFPFIIFHLKPEEKSVMSSKLPWIVSALLFPMWAKKSAASWKHAPYVTYGWFGRYSMY